MESIRERLLLGEAGLRIVRPWDSGPIDVEFARFFCGANIFRVL